jgi:hypothetical protein
LNLKIIFISVSPRQKGNFTIIELKNNIYQRQPPPEGTFRRFFL